uniref:Uncharacterized protein n=1 Tax=Schizaphis graminum TaxID=13262 RepID=A0A2S2PSY7_SCHGA
MGVLYDVLFKPIGRGDLSTAIVADGPTAAGDHPPEWVLDRRGSGPLVWRRYDLPPSCPRRRVRFLDAVQVRVFERDDCADERDADRDDCAGDADDEDGQLCWADDWSWDDDDDARNGSKTAFRGQEDRDDYPVLVAVSVTVLGLCIGLTYLFAPVRWLFHQLLVD